MATQIVELANLSQQKTNEIIHKLAHLAGTAVLIADLSQNTEDSALANDLYEWTTATAGRLGYHLAARQWRGNCYFAPYPIVRADDWEPDDERLRRLL